MDKFDIFLEVFSDEYKAKHHMMYPRKQIQKVDPEFWKELKNYYEMNDLSDKVFKNSNRILNTHNFRAIIQNNNIYHADSMYTVHDGILTWMIINGETTFTKHTLNNWHELGPIKTGFLPIQSTKGQYIAVSESYMWLKEAGYDDASEEKYFSWVFTRPQFKEAIQKLESYGYDMCPLPLGRQSDRWIYEQTHKGK